MNRNQIATIKFNSLYENDEALFIVNKIEESILLAISLEKNGDIEVSFNKEVCQKLIEALKHAIE